MTLRFPLFTVGFAILACAAPEDSATSETDPLDTDTDTDTDTDADADSTTVKITTSLGAITVELDPENAPITTENFLTYVDEGFFDGDDGEGATIFHRVIPDFMIQGGGYTASAAEKDTHAPIKLESDNGLSNLRGSIAMARTNQEDSATSQFFINVVDNDFLDYAGPGSPGYAVFGTVTAGMDVADAIVAVDTNGETPVDDIEITDCERK